MPSRIENLENLLLGGRDTALLRFSLGSAYLTQGHPERAASHLAQAVALDPQYSAAWKLYAKALDASGATLEAISAYEQGITVAEARGDIQAAKEMRMFLKRLRKSKVGNGRAD
ncbi:MAG: tetratricopeptide repeat protein [Gammaproteobacteria bacterium]